MGDLRPPGTTFGTLAGVPCLHRVRKAPTYLSCWLLCAWWSAPLAPYDSDGAVVGLVFLSSSSELRILRFAQIERDESGTFIAGSYDTGVWGRYSACSNCGIGKAFSRRRVSRFGERALRFAWRRLLRVARDRGCVDRGAMPRPVSSDHPNPRTGLRWDEHVRVFWQAGQLVRSDCGAAKHSPTLQQAFDALESTMALVAPRRVVTLPRTIVLHHRVTPLLGASFTVAVFADQAASGSAPVGLVPNRMVDNWDLAAALPLEAPPALHVLGELEQRVLANLMADRPRDSPPEGSSPSVCCFGSHPVLEIDGVRESIQACPGDAGYEAWLNDSVHFLSRVALRALRDSM